MSYYNSTNFTTHTMWSPDGSQSVTVSTLSDHQSYSALGYLHYNPLLVYSPYTTDFPQIVAPESYMLSSMAQTQTSVTHSLNRTVSDRGGHLWKIKFEYAPLTREQFAPIWVHCIGQRGRYGRFSVALPNQEPRGSLLNQANQSIRIKTQATSGNSIALKNFQADQTGVLKQGDYFRIGTSSKVYMLLSDYDADSSGEIASALFYPNLINTAEVDDILYFEPVFTVSLVYDNLECNVPSNNTTNFSVEMVETITNSGSQAIYS